MPTTPAANPIGGGDGLPMQLAHRDAPAFVASLIVHVVLIVGLGWWWTRPQHGTESAPDRQVGIAIAHRQPDRTRYVDATEIAAESQESSEAAGESTAAAAPPADLAPPLDLAGTLQAIQSTPAPAATSGLAGDIALSGSALGGNRGSDQASSPSDTTTVLFGVSGSGSRFVYVFDRSDSMNGSGGRPLRAAKRELIQSLGQLTDRQQFQIIFYNDLPTPLRVPGLPLQLLRGETEMIERATRYVQGVQAFGGTEHDSAIKLALRMSPDVIFFLTDARIPRLSGAELFEIQRRAERSGTTIHAIEFGTDPTAPGDSFLRDLAAMNGGDYQYVSTHGLGPVPSTASVPSNPPPAPSSPSTSANGEGS